MTDPLKMVQAPKRVPLSFSRVTEQLSFGVFVGPFPPGSEPNWQLPTPASPENSEATGAAASGRKAGLGLALLGPPARFDQLERDLDNCLFWVLCWSGA